MVDHHIDLVGCFHDLSTTSRPTVDEDVCVRIAGVTELSAFVCHDMIDVDTNVSFVVNFCECDKGIHVTPRDG